MRYFLQDAGVLKRIVDSSSAGAGERDKGGGMSLPPGP